jgi:F0F1-type ATP synthase assembly protein I
MSRTESGDHKPDSGPYKIVGIDIRASAVSAVVVMIWLASPWWVVSGPIGPPLVLVPLFVFVLLCIFGTLLLGRV